MITSHKKKGRKGKVQQEREKPKIKKKGKERKKKLFAWPGGEPKYMHSAATDGIST